MQSHSSPFTTLIPGVLTICVYTEFAPFAYEAARQIVGTDVTLLQQFAQQSGLAVRLLKKSAFADLWHTPGAGECDIAAAGMAALPERNLGERGVWSIPYMTVQRSLLICRRHISHLCAPADFAHKKIVVTPASTADIDAQQRYAPLGAQIIRHVPSQQAVVQALLSHEIDAFAEGDVSNQYLADQSVDAQGQPLLALVDVHPMTPTEELRFAVRAHDSRLLVALNQFVTTQATEIHRGDTEMHREKSLKSLSVSPLNLRVSL